MVIALDDSDLKKVKKQVKQACGDVHVLKVFANERINNVPGYVTCRNGIGSSLNAVYSKASRLDRDCDELHSTIIAYHNRVGILIYGQEGKEGFFDWLTDKLEDYVDFYVDSVNNTLVIISEVGEAAFEKTEETIGNIAEWYSKNKDVYKNITVDTTIFSYLVGIGAFLCGTLGAVTAAFLSAGAGLQIGLKDNNLKFDTQTLYFGNQNEKDELMRNTPENAIYLAYTGMRFDFFDTRNLFPVLLIPPPGLPLGDDWHSRFFGDRRGEVNIPYKKKEPIPPWVTPYFPNQDEKSFDEVLEEARKHAEEDGYVWMSNGRKYATDDESIIKINGEYYFTKDCVQMGDGKYYLKNDDGIMHSNDGTSDGRYDFKKNVSTKSGYINCPKNGVGFYTTDETPEKYKNDNWGQPKTITTIEEAGKAFNEETGDTFGVVDISQKNGGDSGHKSHRDGYDVDIRLPRTDGKEQGVNISNDKYDREATIKLIQCLIDTGNVEKIKFNDPEIIKMFPKYVKYSDGHDNHLHVDIKH